MLFNNEINSAQNLLPKDGTLNYYGSILSTEKALEYFYKLKTLIEWKNDEIFIFGKQIITKRKTAFYGDEGISYTYSNKKKHALLWTKELLELKNEVERMLGEKFNSCLLNLYHNGSEGMSWHSDNEKELIKNGTIASLSFGDTRKFMFKHKNTKEITSFQLENNSLLVMKDEIQEFWLHQIPVTKKTRSQRINITFRYIPKVEN